jgi:hypothetical protein
MREGTLKSVLEDVLKVNRLPSWCVQLCVHTAWDGPE